MMYGGHLSICSHILKRARWSGFQMVASEMTTYNVVCVRHDVVCTHTTLYVHTMSHVRCCTSISCISHVRHRTYDVQYDVVCCTYDVVRHARTTSARIQMIRSKENPDIGTHDPISCRWVTRYRVKPRYLVWQGSR